MSIAILMAMASCSSSDDAVEEIKEESKLVPMTFTATQESNVGTRSALNGSNGVDWQTNDKISVFDAVGDGHNQRFTLTGEATEGKFSGEASSEATQFTAVYPYTDGAQLKSDGSVSGITLPAEQTATANSFDPAAALMMAVSTTDKKYNLDFKNAVSLVKVTPKFDCTKIELAAADGESSAILAGKGTLNWNDGQPKINITEEISPKITITGSILKGNSYYIVVPTGTLNRMWKITFTANDVNKTVYTRYCSKSLTIERNKIINLGDFATDSPFWADEHRGNKVTYEQEVDLGLTITADSKQYRVIFANANLTATGLAVSATDYGDYFAWGATEPWYTSYTTGTDGGGKPTVTSEGWKTYHTNGYANGTAPTFNGKYDKIKDFEMSDDPARQILGGGWQIPTKAIWDELKSKMNNLTKQGFNSERKGYEFVNNDQTLFLPAAGYVSGTSFSGAGSYGYYWSGTAFSNTYYPNTKAYYLTLDSKGVAVDWNEDRYYGCSVRPVRLVEVPQ